MAVFVIMEGTENPLVAQRIKEAYPNDHLKVARGQWLVSDTGNARTVSEKLGFWKDSGIGGTLVFATSSYYGLHSSDVWDWIKTKLEAA